MTVKNFVEFFQAMSDPTRQKILLLLDKKERCVQDLVKEFNLSQPTVSKHLLVLKYAGLVKDHRQGQRVFYSLNKDWLRDCCADYFSKFQCCGSFFDKGDKEEVKTDEEIYDSSSSSL